MNSFIQQLKQQLQQPLPGLVAHQKMTHATRYSYPSPSADARNAGVMALFYPSETAEMNLVFIQRSAKDPRDKHGGQIGFPGGKYEVTDPSLQHTALRETEEEIGISSKQIEVIGKLSELYIPVSNFLVHPYVGYTTVQPTFVPQVSEVDAVIETPFHLFEQDDIVKKSDMSIRNCVLKEVPHFKVEDTVIWGATAMMLSELLMVAGVTWE